MILRETNRELEIVIFFFLFLPVGFHGTECLGGFLRIFVFFLLAIPFLFSFVDLEGSGQWF